MSICIYVINDLGKANRLSRFSRKVVPVSALRVVPIYLALLAPYLKQIKLEYRKGKKWRSLRIAD